MIVLATPVIRVGGITMSSSAPRNCSPPSMPLSVTAIANTRSVRSVLLLCSVLVMVCSSGRHALGHSPPAAGTRARLFYVLAEQGRYSAGCHADEGADAVGRGGGDRAEQQLT